ncbi:MAG: glutathione S-transferase [Cellvibrionaceae bacterium]
MKLYDCHPAPNPRRVRIFIAEKGLDIPTVQVDLPGREQHTEEFRRLNPLCDVPVLALDDGSHISQVNGICRYLETAFPEPNLYGTDPKEQGQIAMWDNFAANQGLSAVADAFRNTAKSFAERAVLGSRPYPQIPELAERGKNRTLDFMEDLNNYLAERKYIANDRFSAADITTLVALDFAKWIKVEIDPSHNHLQRWYDTVSSRPSAKA